MHIRIEAADRTAAAAAVYTFRGVALDDAFLDTPGALMFVARAGTDVAGWCWGHRLPRPDGPAMLYLHHLEVAAAHRRRGVGRSLVTAFVEAGVAAGATRMFLTTAAANAAARALYDSLGGAPALQGPTVNYWFQFDRVPS